MRFGAAMLAEREHLLPLAEQQFDLAEVSFPVVDGMGCVRVRTNAYSTPLKVGTAVEAKVYSTYVEIWHEGRQVARHERCYERQQQVLELEHYLDVLEKKPGALAGSKPLEQWRQAGRWPDSYDQLWAELVKRHGRPVGTRQMIEMLHLGKAHGHDRLRAAVASAIDSGAHDVSAVRYLLLAKQEPLNLPAIEIGALDRYERPLPLLNEYDRLLEGVAP